MMKAHWIDDMSAVAYMADPCETPSLSASIANVLLSKTPWHAHRAHPRLGVKSSAATPAQDRGEIVHALVLGQAHRFAVINVDDFKTRIARDMRDAAIFDGKTPIKASFFEQCEEEASEIRTNLATAGFAIDGRPSQVAERVAIWEDNGTLCRGRLDCVDTRERLIYDLKTTRDGSYRAIERSVREYGYHVQRAAYVRAWEAIEPDWAGRIKFVFLFVEQETNAVIPVELGAILQEVGERRWDRAVRAWGRCLREGRWPGYAQPDRAVMVDADEWYTTRDQFDGARLNAMIEGV